MSKKVKILHDIDEFNEGEEVILTLKDQYLIKGYDLNEDIEELENANIREKAQAEHNNYIKKNLKKLANAETSHIEYKLQGKAGEQALLPHYDDHNYKREGFTVMQDEDAQDFKPTANLFQSFKEKKEAESRLIAEQQKPASEYMEAKIKQRKGNNNNKNPDKAAATKQLISFLQETAMSDEEKDPLKRTAEQALESLEKIRKRRNYDKAIEKAMIETAKTQQRMREMEEYELELAIKKQRKAEPIKPAHVMLAEALKEAPADKPAESNEKTVEIELDPIKANLLKTSIKPTEPTESKPVNLTIGDARNGTTSVLNVSLPSERLSKKQEDLLDQIPEKWEDIPKEELQRMKKELQFMEEQDMGVGLTGALKFLRERGMADSSEYVGRSRDYVPKNNVNEDSNDRIKLEYRDANGKLMTPKEAFRYMCWIFHGEGPGQNKIQKRKKRQLMNQRIKAMQSGDSTFMKILKEHQGKSEEPHLFIKQSK